MQSTAAEARLVEHLVGILRIPEAESAGRNPSNSSWPRPDAASFAIARTWNTARSIILPWTAVFAARSLT